MRLFRVYLFCEEFERVGYIFPGRVENSSGNNLINMRNLVWKLQELLPSHLQIFFSSNTIILYCTTSRHSLRYALIDFIEYTDTA